MVCGNCDTPFTLKEYQATHIARSTWEQEVLALESAVKQAEEAVDRATTHRDKASLEVVQRRRRRGEGGGGHIRRCC